MVKQTKSLKLIINICNILGIILISISIAVFWNISFAIGIMVTLLMFSLLFRNMKNDSVYRFDFLWALILSSGFGYLFWVVFDPSIYNKSSYWGILIAVGFELFIFKYVFFLIKEYIYLFNNNKHNKNEIVLFELTIIFVGYVIYVYLPSIIFFNYYNEFMFSYKVLLYSLIPHFLMLLLACNIIFLVFPKAIFRLIYKLGVGICLFIYFQYIFFNKNLNEFNGSKYIWKNDILNSLLDLLIIIICILLPYIWDWYSKKENLKKYIMIIWFLLIIQLTDMTVNIIKAPSDAFSNTVYKYSAEEQYVVSGDGNVIILILDAVDNMYIEDILDTNPELFDDFNDFTLYMNTCSVYDKTYESTNQMFSGYCLGDDYNGCTDEFYSRIKDNGYIVNMYNFTYDARFPDITKYIDNRILLNLNDNNNCTIKYDMIYNDFLDLSLFQILPNVTKNVIDTTALNFNYIYANNVDDSVVAKNEAFGRDMKFSLSSKENKYIKVYHINGAHMPCDYMTETKTCIGVCSELVKQLKEIGAYDNSTIIFMADHGLHDDDSYFSYPTAGTPMFMIKEPLKTSNKITISNAPIYYEDFLPTLLVNMKLYEDNDEKMFGNSIYDISEDMDRERIWFDKEGRKYRKYRYIGNYEELKKVVKKGKYELIKY